jgi:hypothetical protein
VRSFKHGNQKAGKHSLIFDGLDSGGRTLSSGVYFYRLKTGDKTLQRKMILMK